MPETSIVVRELAPGVLARFRAGNLDAAEADGDELVDDGDVVSGEGGDAFDLLPEDDDGDGRGAVPRRK